MEHIADQTNDVRRRMEDSMIVCCPPSRSTVTPLRGQGKSRAIHQAWASPLSTRSNNKGLLTPMAYSVQHQQLLRHHRQTGRDMRCRPSLVAAAQSVR
jgi:hypothetical protein